MLRILSNFKMFIRYFIFFWELSVHYISVFSVRQFYILNVFNYLVSYLFTYLFSY